MLHPVCTNLLSSDEKEFCSVKVSKPYAVKEQCIAFAMLRA